MKIRVGIIGAGNMGMLHASTIAKSNESEIISFVEPDTEKAGIVKSVYNVPVYEKINSSFLNSIDVAIVATPTNVKEEICRILSSRVAGIFLEKPIAVDYASALRIKQIIKSHKIKTQVGYQRRYDTQMIELKRTIESGRLGEIISISSITRDPPVNHTGWIADTKQSGGIFFDSCSHDFDLIRWLTGTNVHRVYAEGNNISHPELYSNDILDIVSINMALTSGAIGHVECCSYTVHGYDIRVEILGNKNTTHVGKLDGCFPKNFVERFSQAYKDEMIDFLQHIEDREEPAVSIDDGVEAIRIASASKKSFYQKSPCYINSIQGE